MLFRSTLHHGQHAGLVEPRRRFSLFPSLTRRNRSFFFCADRRDYINQEPYRKTQNKEKKTTKPFWIPAASSSSSTLRRRIPPPLLHATLDWEEPPSGQEVDGPRHRSASILHNEQRRQLGQHHRLRQILQTPAPPPRKPAEGSVARISAETQTRLGQQICRRAPPEHLKQRKEPPPAKASPVTPSPP